MVSDTDLEGTLSFADVVRATLALSQVNDSYGGASDPVSNGVNVSIRQGHSSGIGDKGANVTFATLVCTSGSGRM